MNTILEFNIDCFTALPQTIYLPTASKVFYATAHGSSITLYVLADSTCTTTELRTFVVHSSGDLFSDKVVEYITTFDGILGVRHLFEVASKQ